MAGPRIVLVGSGQEHFQLDLDLGREVLATDARPVVVTVVPGPGRPEESVEDGVRVIRVPLLTRPSVIVDPEHVEETTPSAVSSGKPAKPARSHAPRPHRPVSEQVAKLRRRRGAYAERVTGLNKSSAASAARWATVSAKLAKDDLLDAALAARHLGRQALVAARHTARDLRSDLQDRLQAAEEAKAAAPVAAAPVADLFEGLDLAEREPLTDQLAFSLTDLLVALRPDVIHASDADVVPAVWQAAAQLNVARPVATSCGAMSGAQGALAEAVRRFEARADHVVRPGDGSLAGTLVRIARRGQGRRSRSTVPTTLVPPLKDAPQRPDGGEAPHVVLFRHSPIDIDTRAKKIALSLRRGGYRVTFVSVEPRDTEPRQDWLGDIPVLRVPLRSAPPAAEPEAEGPPVGPVAKLLGVRPAGSPAPLSPLVADHVETLSGLLVDLKPDILHVHHPLVFEAAKAALEQLGPDVRVVYDARENWAGLPTIEKGNRTKHNEVLESEAAGVAFTDGVITVAEPLADELKERFHIAKRPLVLLHYPARFTLSGSDTLRDQLGLADDVTLLVYSGILSRARDLPLLVRGLADLPDHVHLALVAVPFPHPQAPELRAVATEEGIDQARLHFAPPVSQHELANYLSGADIAVSAIPKGSPNHDIALPNKLFEYLHAGLPLVTADAPAMAAFTVANGTGTVFESGSVEGYVAAVKEQLAHPSDPEAVARAADECSWQQIEEPMLRFYDELTGFRSHLTDAPFPELGVTDQPRP